MLREAALSLSRPKAPGQTPQEEPRCLGVSTKQRAFSEPDRAVTWGSPETTPGARQPFSTPVFFFIWDRAYAWMRTCCVRRFFSLRPSECANRQPQTDPRCRFPALADLEVGPASRLTCQGKRRPRNVPGTIFKGCRPSAGIADLPEREACSCGLRGEFP